MSLFKADVLAHCCVHASSRLTSLFPSGAQAKYWTPSGMSAEVINVLKSEVSFMKFQVENFEPVVPPIGRSYLK